MSDEAQQVVVPGAEGDFTVLAGHAPFISTLRPGILDVTLPQGRQRLLVKKGVAEVDPDRLTVLAQSAVPLEELDGAANSPASCGLPRHRPPRRRTIRRR